MLTHCSRIVLFNAPSFGETIKIVPPAVVTGLPATSSYFPKIPFVLSASFSGASPLSFVWRADGNVVSIGTVPQLSVDGVTVASLYNVTASNDLGEAWTAVSIRAVGELVSSFYVHPRTLMLPCVIFGCLLPCLLT